MRGCAVATTSAGAAAVLIVIVGAALAATTPMVEVLAPASSTWGLAFPVSAEAAGCKPREWRWTSPSACTLKPVSLGRVTIACPEEAGRTVSVSAAAWGGNCKGASGTTSLILTGEPAALPSQPACLPEDAYPAAVVTPPAGGLYYRPGLPSTGRLNLQIVPEELQVVPREGITFYACPKEKL